MQLGRKNPFSHGGQPEEDEVMNAGRQQLFSTSVMVYFTWRQGQGTGSLSWTTGGSLVLSQA